MPPSRTSAPSPTPLNKNVPPVPSTTPTSKASPPGSLFSPFRLRPGPLSSLFVFFRLRRGRVWPRFILPKRQIQHPFIPLVAHSPPLSLPPSQKTTKKFGANKKTSYLCGVKMIHRHPFDVKPTKILTIKKIQLCTQSHSSSQ